MFRKMMILGAAVAVSSGVSADSPGSPVSLDVFTDGTALVTRRIVPPLDGVVRFVTADVPLAGTFRATASNPVTLQKGEARVKGTVVYRVAAGLRDLLDSGASAPGAHIRVGAVSAAEPNALARAEGSLRQEGDSVRVETPGGTALSIPYANIAGIAAEADWTEDAQEWTLTGERNPYAIAYWIAGPRWTPSCILTVSGDAARLQAWAELANDSSGDWTDVMVSLVSGTLARQADAPILRTRLYGRTLAKGANFGFAADGAPEEMAAPQGDVVYRPIGKVSLKKNETRTLSLGEAETAVRRLVSWNADTEGAGALWDVVCFTNTFAVPLDACPVLVQSGNHVLGQGTIAWTEPGAEAEMRLARARSVTGECKVLGRGSREVKSADGVTERLEKEAEVVLTLKNTRTEAVTVKVVREITGEIVEVSPAPGGQTTRSSPEIGAIDDIQRIVWNVLLAAGEEKELRLRYRYSAKM